MKTEKKYIEAIEKRGYETRFLVGRSGDGWKRAKRREMELIEKKRGYRLYKLDGWKKYSRHVTWYVQYTYIAGCENGQYWANRVPGRIEKIDEALDWLRPAEVKKSKKVLRQGDVFVIEKTKDCKSILPSNHNWNAETRILSHPEHKDLHVDFPCKFVLAKQIGNGRD